MREVEPIRLPFGASRVSGWKLLICFVLAFSFLYNPFLLFPVAGSHSTLNHAASHRATVGASELQHFNTVDAQKLLASAAFVAILVNFFLVSLVVYSRVKPRVLLVIPQEFGSPSLWVRPPPALA